MDKRLPLLKQLYLIHGELVEIFHKRVSDNNSLKEFCRIYVEFVNVLNPSVSNRLFDYIFNTRPDLGNKRILNAHLYSAKIYAQNILDRIAENHELNLSNELIGIVFDYPKLLNAVERVYNIPFGKFIGNRNMKVDSYTSFKVANQIYWGMNGIERSNTLNGYSIFAIRQSIELAGKELLGLECLVDKNGKDFKYGTRIPWEFIVLNKSSSHFIFPFDPTEIIKIYSWSNHFVHTGGNAFCYVTGQALLTIKSLYQRKKTTNVFGEEEFNYANEINGYKALKIKFENYLISQHTKNPIYAKWALNPALAHVLSE